MKFSVVVPMFKVEEYLPAMLETFGSQKTDETFSLEFIFIDDGSPDNCAAIVEQWSATVPFEVRLIRQANQGVSAARNRGISEASGEWITFPDPDDYFNDEYFISVARFIGSEDGATASLIATNIIRHFDIDNSVRNTHALKFRFASGTKAIDLAASPHYIHLSAPSGFFRRERVVAQGIEFKVGLHASEDALFSAQYLLSFEAPVLGVVAEAKYYYRKRADESSAMDSFRKSSKSYINRFVDGYLPLVSQVKTEQGRIPDWFASQICYEYRWLLSAENNAQAKAVMLTESEKSTFVSTAKAILGQLERYQIEMYRTTTLQPECRLLMLAWHGLDFPMRSIELWQINSRRNLLGLRYYYTGDLPVETIHSRGRRIEPFTAKTRTLDYFGQKDLKQRVLWLPANSWIEVRLDGVPMELTETGDTVGKLSFTERATHLAILKHSYKAEGRSIRWRNAPRPQLPQFPRSLNPITLVSVAVARAKWNLRRKRYSYGLNEILRKQYLVNRRLFGQTLHWATASTSWNAKKYANAWLLQDRLDVANDNAEHLARYIYKNHPERNVWFVLQKNSADWDRLKKQGFKLLEFGSRQHQYALMNADHVISSHVDVEMIRPKSPTFYPGGRIDYQFTFLQHGVTKDDLSLWLNKKEMDLVVTISEREKQSFSGDHTRYLLADHQVVTSGFPRYDRLHDLGSTSAKDVILIAPTWRGSLLTKTRGNAVRALADGFKETDYYLNWQALIASPELTAYAQQNNLEIVLLPHPNMSAHIKQFDVPSHVRIESYSESDVQTLFARAKTMITDYSSVAFDVAYAGGDVVYFQFDKDTIFSGGHTMEKGYFEYERDGLGPVALTHQEVLSALSPDSAETHSVYAQRATELFAHRDNENCARTYEAISALDTPATTV